jgi:ATP-dependent Clp protease protease subunit
MKRFWNWSGPQRQRSLTINGTIAEDSWVDDDVTPQVFQDELKSRSRIQSISG